MKYNKNENPITEWIKKHPKEWAKQTKATHKKYPRLKQIENEAIKKGLKCLT